MDMDTDQLEVTGRTFLPPILYRNRRKRRLPLQPDCAAPWPLPPPSPPARSQHSYYTLSLPLSSPSSSSLVKSSPK